MAIERDSDLSPIVWAALALAVAAALLLPLNLLRLQPFHHDEALYSTWALQITSGADPWLSHTPIDKPPLYLYTVAAALRLLGPTTTAARTPSLLAGAMAVLLTFWLGRRLYGAAVGLLAAWLLALSPFVLMFSPTAFTDPLLVALILAGGVAASYRRAGLAGLALGLAIATKQQGIFFAPLLAGVLLKSGVGSQESGVRQRWPALIRLVVSAGLVLLPAFLWDAARAQPSGFLVASVANYGGLAPDPAGFGERWQGFLKLMTYATASPLLNAIFLVGLPLLLLAGPWLFRSQPGAPRADWLLAGFGLAFLLLHALLSFQVWDRYLLGLMPLLALLLARILLLPQTIFDFRFSMVDKSGTIQNSKFKLQTFTHWVWAAAIALLLTLTLIRPVQDAVSARYPLGSQSDALRGIEQINGYLQGQAGANSTLYHRWLGTHWRFYLWGYPYDLQYWDTPADLAARAQPGHLIAFPTNRSSTESRLALAQAGLSLRELTRAYAPNGSPTIILYQITESRIQNSESR